MAILLSRAGWEVVLVEQHAYPRRKVCGECITAGSLALLDELGVEAGVRAHAGPELRHIGWMSERPTLIADFPSCTRGPYRYGRALRREHLDGLLVARARAQGVVVLQPARVRAVRGEPGAFRCDIDHDQPAPIQTVLASTVIDAHGSWQRGPDVLADGQRQVSRSKHRRSDLFAFKAVFQHTALRPGLLSVMGLPGGYGGMVIADQGEATLACCLRRDTLTVCRAVQPGLPIGEAIETYLRQTCLGIREALQGARRVGPWLSVGPLRPGMSRPADHALFRVGNAAGESHPLIGEGIGMALHAAVLLAHELTRLSPATIDAHSARSAQRCYALAWHREFSRRLRLAALYAFVAMRPALTRPARALLRRWPTLLTDAARLAGKARGATLKLSHSPPRTYHEHA
jgi:2-polyprenyl-6-methoxyphenol hydroxylase-like FAD-dependent oxidoreductase